MTGNDRFGSDKAKDFARALAPVAERVGVEKDELIQHEAPEISEDAPPDDMAEKLADLLGAADGKWGLFMRNSQVIAWDNEAGDFTEMTAKRFRSWITPNRGVVFVKKRVPEKDPEGNNTGRWFTVKGQLIKDKADVVLASDVLRGKLPKISGFNPVKLPVIDNGDIRLLQPGYDQRTGIYTHAGMAYDEGMSFDEGINHIYSVFHTFGWRNEDRDFAIHLAGMLSLFCKEMYSGRAPGFVYNANIQSSGKTLLAMCGPWALYGTRKTLPLLKDQDARLQETMNSLALGGVGYVIWDNIKWGNEPVETELMDQWLSNVEWDFRKLNVQQMLAPKLRCVNYLTGNNLRMSTDLQRRTLMCDLWNPLAAKDRPRPPGMVMLDDDFFGDPKQRSLMLAALWSIVREWDKAGRPSGTRELDSFNVWSRVVPGIVLAAGKAFHRNWDCMAENTNENVGDKAARDFQRLAEIAMSEFGKGEHGMRDTFEVTVQQLAGVARRHAIEECQFALYPEKDIESVMQTEDKKGGWEFKRPDKVGFMAADWIEEAERRRQAAEWMNPASRSKFGNAVKSALNERYFKGSDGFHYQWLHRAGATPARYAVTRVERKSSRCPAESDG